MHDDKHNGVLVVSLSISGYTLYTAAQYNTLDTALPEGGTFTSNVLRNAGVGLAASSAAAVASNWARILKTSKQAHDSGRLGPTTYAKVGLLLP